MRKRFIHVTSNDLSQEHLTWTISRTCYICRSVKLRIRIHPRLERRTGSRWNEWPGCGRISLKRGKRLWILKFRYVFLLTLYIYFFFNSRDPVSIKDELVNIDWNPVTTDEFSYLDIGEELRILPVPQHLLFFERNL